MAIIEMDGDSYEMRFPSIEEWKKIKPLTVLHKNDNVPVQTHFANWTAIVRHTQAEQMTDQDAGPDMDHVLRISDTGQVLVKTYPMLALIPCLIPLDKNKNSIERRFQLENPNGSVVFGGTWDYDHRKFIDTRKKQVEWIIMDGKLFSRRAVYYMTPQEIGGNIIFW